MADQVFVQHRFTDDASGFTDAIVLPLAQYELLTADEIDALKAERIAAHVALMAEVANRPLPTEAEIAAARETERRELEVRLAELDG